MKIAILLAGHTRDWEQNIQTLRDFINIYNIDVFISTYAQTGKNSTFWAGEHTSSYEKESNIQQIIDTYKPKNIMVHNEIPASTNNKLPQSNYKVSIDNVSFMFQRITDTIKMCLEYAAKNNIIYDVILRARFDIDITIESIIPPNSNTLYGVISPINKLFSDIFFYGNQEVFSKLLLLNDVFLYSDHILKTAINGEDVFNKFLDEHNIIKSQSPGTTIVLKGITY